MKSKLILLDFDGTIGNTMPIMLSTINRALIENNQRPFDEIMSEYEDGTAFLYGFDYAIDKELKGNENAKKLKGDLVNIIHNEYAKCDLISGVADFIKYIHKKNIPMIVLTCNKEEIVKRFLSSQNLLDYFKEIIGSENLIENKKDVNTYNFILQKYNLQADECAMFEDSYKPLDEANKAGLNTVLINEEKANGITVFCDFTDINAILNNI